MLEDQHNLVGEYVGWYVDLTFKIYFIVISYGKSAILAINVCNWCVSLVGERSWVRRAL